MRLSIPLFLLLVLVGAWSVHLYRENASLRQSLGEERARGSELETGKRDLSTPAPTRLPVVPSVAKPPNHVAPAPEVEVSLEEPGHRYDFESLKALLLANDPQLWEMITPSLIEETLEKFGRTAPLLTAAAILSSDPDESLAYLEEALEKDPTSPATLAAYLGNLAGQGNTGESFLAAVDALEKVDPGNALLNYYAALSQIQNGDTAQALEEIREASSKNLLTNYGLSHLPAMEKFYRNADCSELVAKTMALFNAKLEHLSPLRDVGRFLAENIEEASRQGFYDRALSLAHDGAQLGKNLSSSEQLLITDLVGMAIEKKILEAELAIYRAQGNPSEVDRVERRMRSNELRHERIKKIGAVLPHVAMELSEAELMEYLNHVSVSGEDTAAMQLPRIRELLTRSAEN